MIQSSVMNSLRRNCKCIQVFAPKTSFRVKHAATIETKENQEAGQWACAKPFEDIPSFTMLPVIGTAWTYMPIIGRYKLQKQHLAAKEKRKIFGDILREKFGPFNMVLSFRPEDLETIFRNEGPYPFRLAFETLKAYRESRKQWYKTGGLLILQGEEWHDLRSKAQKHLLKPKAIQAYLYPMQDVARDFVSRMFTIKDAKGEVPDFLGELYKWALESVGFVSLDTRLGCLQSNLPPDSDGMRMIKAVQTKFECFNNLESPAGNLGLWKLFPTPAWKRFCKAGDVFTEIAFKYINRSLEVLKQNESNDEKELTLLQCMLASGMDVSKTMVTVSDMLLAGIDTTSHAVGFMLYNLAKNPEKQECLYREITTFLPNKEDKISSKIMDELKYLKACLKESMRMNPVAGGVIRALNRDVVLSGYKIPAGTNIAVGLQEIYLDEKYFENPNNFLPERWLDKNKKSNPFAFLPFGFGTRSCIGKRLAELEMICLVTEIMRNFKVEYHYEDIGMLTRLVNTPDKPLRFKFIERG